MSFLYPFNELPTPFADLVAESTSPWNDPGGFWATYNAALATMFEEVYDLIADLGDPIQTVIAAVSTSLSTSGPITSVPVQSVSEVVPVGAEVTLSGIEGTQLLELAAGTHVGDTSISVASFTPNFPYPIGTPVQLAYSPGWSILLDPNNCPDQFLPFLAQFNGTPIPIDLDPATLRAQIIGESGLSRGTLGAVISAVTRNLTGNQSVILQERLNALGNPDGYWFIVIVRPEQVISTAALINAVNLVKPGGVQWTLVETDGWIISQMEASQATLAALEANFATITGLEQDLPGT